jgi:hypothetical protein
MLWYPLYALGDRSYKGGNRYRFKRLSQDIKSAEKKRTLLCIIKVADGREDHKDNIPW